MPKKVVKMFFKLIMWLLIGLIGMIIFVVGFFYFKDKYKYYSNRNNLNFFIKNKQEYITLLQTIDNEINNLGYTCVSIEESESCLSNLKLNPENGDFYLNLNIYSLIFKEWGETYIKTNYVLATGGKIYDWIIFYNGDDFYNHQSKSSFYLPLGSGFYLEKIYY